MELFGKDTITIEVFLFAQSSEFTEKSQKEKFNCQFLYETNAA